VERCQLVVVGAGVVGLAIAREAQTRGLATSVLERAGVGAGASGVQPGGVRQQWGTRIACRLARESVEFWRDAERRLESNVAFRLEFCGYMFVAHSAMTYERFAANVRLQNEEGVPSHALTPEEATSIVPGLDGSEIAGAAWCAEDGYFDRPQAVVEAFARGVDVRHCHVKRIAPNGAGWKVTASDGVSVSADTVVIAAGVGTTALVAPLGVHLPLAGEDRFLFLSDPISDRLLEPLVVAPELSFAAKQLASGRMLASDLGARGDPAAGQARWRETIRNGCTTLLPRLEFVSFPLLVAGVYDMTPDHQPVLGPVGGREGLFVACGFSGHGFMISPAVARIIVDAIVGDRDDVLDVLDAGRFDEGRLVAEPQVI
jgi:glycine/D-amino acid oxidase-like deaminating enzyme